MRAYLTTIVLFASFMIPIVSQAQPKTPLYVHNDTGESLQVMLKVIFASGYHTTNLNMNSGSRVTKRFLAPQAFQLIYQHNNVATQTACQGPKAPGVGLGGGITLSLTKASDGTLACSWYTL